ncbi:MAG TPA: hypothetical protein EYQ50_25935 [Verrucomicrobiales bacterium]|nr:hypothetical protein [Verrucomicrobiales bacterium]
MKPISISAFKLLYFLVISAWCPTLLAAEPIRVLVWDEQQPRQKPMYPEFIGNHLADSLKKNKNLEVRTANLNQPEIGLGKTSLDQTDVLVYWAHVRHDDVPNVIADDIARRIQEGRLSMITLHSAHWAAPFRSAMEARAIQDTHKMLSLKDRDKVDIQWNTWRARVVPTRHQNPDITRHFEMNQEGRIKVLLERPTCIFPSCCTPIQPSQIRTLLPDHPIAKGIPKTFALPETEMYDEPYHVPTPDQVIFDETWQGGEYFRSGILWNIGKGKVFYFRPGHETYNVYHQPLPLKVIENACVYLGNTLHDSGTHVSIQGTLKKILVFSKTSWYRHPMIPLINDFYIELGKEKGFEVTTSENPDSFNSVGLKDYQVVVFNNTTDIGKSLNSDQKEAFIRWFRNGGGLVATHAAGVHHDTWDWYAELFGTNFNSDSEYINARIVTDPMAISHPINQRQRKVMWLEGDWLNFDKNIRDLPGVTVLSGLDENSYDPVRPLFERRGGKSMGQDHPMAWVREFQGGRFFYSAIGHDTRPLEVPYGEEHILRGILWAARELN